MKKNQLFGILALMMALGMTFPASTFASNNSSGQTKLSESSESGVLPSDEKDQEHEEKEDDDSDGDDDDKDTNPDPSEPLDPENPVGPDEPTDPGSSEDTPIRPDIIRSYEELVSILSDEAYTEIDYVTLTNDIIVDSALEISRDHFTIDLNGHSIISCQSGNGLYEESARVIDVKSGNLTIVGEGNIMAMGQGGVAISVRGSSVESSTNYATVTISEQVTLRAPKSYGIIISPSANAAYGVTINLRGTISAESGIYLNGNIQATGENAPKFNLADGARIEADNIAVHAAGYGIWHLGNAELSSATGIVLRTGDFYLENTIILAQGSDQYNDGTGAAFKIDEAGQSGIKVTIDGGTYVSTNNYVFTDYGELDGVGSALSSLVIKNGEFTSAQGVFFGIPAEDDSPVEIHGGTYTSDVSDFLAADAEIIVAEDGLTWTVIGAESAELVQAKANLRALVEVAREKEASYYTDESYQKLLAALESALGLLESEDLTLDQVREAEDSLSVALDELETLDDDTLADLLAAKQRLSDKIQAAYELDASLYDPSDFQELMDIVGRAEVLLTQSDLTVDLIEGMLGELEATWELLMPYDEDEALAAAKALLSDLVAEVYNFLEEIDELDTDYDELRELLIEAENILAEGALGITKDLIDSMKLRIEDVYTELSTPGQDRPDQPEVPEEPETPEVPETPEIPEIPETPTNPDDGDEHPDQPGGIVDPADPTDPIDPADPGEVDTTIEELRSGVSEMLAAVSDLTIGDYLDEFTDQYYALQAAISEATALLADPAASSADLAAVMNKIVSATTGLKKIDNDTPATPVEPVPLDTSILMTVVTNIAKLDSAAYTSESYTRVLEVLNRTQSTLSNPDATQKQIDDLVLELNSAVASLVLAPAAPTIPTAPTVPTTPVVPTTPTTPTNPAQPSRPYQTSTPATTASPNYQPYQNPAYQHQNTLPNTGVNGQQLPGAEVIAPSFTMSLLAGAYAGIATYRKNRLAAKQAKALKAPRRKF